MISATFAATISGCSTYKPLPENYTGPTANVEDSGFTEGSTKAQIFALVEIDGHSITDSFQATRRASASQGATISLFIIDRNIKSTPTKVKIRGSHATGMPIHEFASRAAGTFFEVEGVVDFDPAPNAKYRVTGSLSKSTSSVWIEELETHKAVTEKISSTR